jgi:uncharacterized protein YbaR (Trm112 family)
VRTLEPWLREILRCPSCSGMLRDADARSEPSGLLRAELHRQEPSLSEQPRPELHCTVCRLAFRVDDGIPVLLIDEARPIDEGA